MRFAVVLSLLLAAPVAADAPKPRTDPLGDPLPEGALMRYGTTRLHHGTSFFEFTADGKALVTGSIDWGVRVWDTATGRLLASRPPDRVPEAFAPHTGSPPRYTPAALTPDGRVVLVGPSPCCRLWDPATGRAPVLWDAPEGEATAAALSPDGKALAVVSLGRAALIDLATGKELSRLDLGKLLPRLHPGPDERRCLALSPDNRTLAVGTADGMVWLFDWASGRRLRVYAAFADARFGGQHVTAVAFRPDGKAIAAAAGGKLHLFHADRAEPVEGFTPPEAPFAVIRFTADGRRLVSAGSDGVLRHWDAATGKLLSSVSGADASGREAAVALDPTGRAFAVVPWYDVRLLDARTGKPLLTLPRYEAFPRCAFLDRAGKTAACTELGGRLHVWDVATGRRKADAPPGLPRTHIAVLSADGRRLAGPDKEGGLLLLDVGSGKEHPPLDASGGTSGQLALSPDGRLAAVIGGGVVEVWDVDAGRRRHALNFEDLRVQTLAWSHDGKCLAVYPHAAQGNGHVWEMATGRLRARRELREGPSVICFLADGRLAAAMKSEIALSRPGDERDDRLPPVEGAYCMAASRDGRWLAVGDLSGHVHLIEPDGPRRYELPGHEGYVMSLAFSGDSSRLLSTSVDGTAIAWDLHALPAKRPTRPAPEADVKACWEALASPDAAAAGKAMAALHGQPRAAVALLRQHLKPSQRVDAKALAGLLTNLDSPKFAVRQKAVKALEDLGERVEGALQQALAGKTTLEVRRSVLGLLQKLADERPDLVRAGRAVELLEQIGTREARALLESLAGGEPAARLTREAAASLRRLADR